MIEFNDKSSDCYGCTKHLTKGQIDYLANVIRQHRQNYQPNLLTRQIDEEFGLSKLTDCIHRYVKQLVGITVH